MTPAATLRWGEHVVTFDADFKKLLKPDHVTMLVPI
jgi:hypothetical protein